MLFYFYSKQNIYFRILNKQENEKILNSSKNLKNQDIKSIPISLKCVFFLLFYFSEILIQLHSPNGGHN